MNDVPCSAALLLAAIVAGKQLFAPDDGSELRMRLVTLGGQSHSLAVSPADLAILEERALIVWGPDDPETGIPTTLNATEYGKVWLKRYMLSNKLQSLRIVEPIQ